MLLLVLVFFFQAEDGIRDVAVTGVQTCALPIFGAAAAGDDDLRPAPRQRPRRREPHPAAGAGEQRHLSFQAPLAHVMRILSPSCASTPARWASSASVSRPCCCATSCRARRTCAR